MPAPMPTAPADKALRFRKLHEGPGAFLIANAWDAGSARILAGLGFQALATSSGACAGTLGRRDGAVTRDEALAHARAIVDGNRSPRVGRSGEMLRRRARSRGRGHPARGRESGSPAARSRTRAAARTSRSSISSTRCERVAAAAEAAKRIRRRVRSHGADRELPARQAGPRRHHPAPSGVRESRRRRPHGAGAARSRGGALRVRRVEESR